MISIRFIFRRDKSHFIYCLAFFFILCLVLADCKKEEDASIKITNLKPIQSIFQRDTLRIEYQATSSGLDSVCLLINDVITDTQTTPKKLFMYIPAGEGSVSVQLKLGAYYKSGIKKFTEIYYVNVSNLYTPPLYYKITRSDGFSVYFVGEKLAITLNAEGNDLDQFRQITLSLNKDNLGTKTSPPYTFISNEILVSENTIYVELKDQNNRIHSVKKELTVPVNTPPVVNYDFYYQGIAEPRVFLNSDSIFTVFMGSDDHLIDHVDFFVDDRKITSYIAKNQSAYKIVNMGVYAEGTHSISCVAYDDRGASTKSPVFPFSVYTGFELDDDIVDVEYSAKEDMVFLCSKSELYVINPVKGELSATVNLPYSDANSIDFVPEENNLYIAFNQGKLFRWNCGTQVLSEIALTDIPGIQDIEIDSDHDAVMVSNHILLFYNFSTGKRSTGAVALDDGATMVFDKPEKIIVSGGNPHSSGSYIYEHKLISDSLHYIRRNYNGGFADKLQLDPVNNKFLISSRGGYSSGVTTYDLVSFAVNGVFNVIYPIISTYSSDGNLVFIGDDNDEILSVFDAKTNALLNTYAIPRGNQTRINKILPNINNSTLTIVRKSIFYPEGKILFVRLK